MPPNVTAGLARSRVRGYRRSPAPPANRTPRVSFMVCCLDDDCYRSVNTSIGKTSRSEMPNREPRTKNWGLVLAYALVRCTPATSYPLDNPLIFAKVRARILRPGNATMKNVYEVLRQKEMELAKLEREVEALRVAAPLLTDDKEVVAETPKPTLATAVPQQPIRIPQPAVNTAPQPARAVGWE